ncbi:MAG TPA: alpha/beta hydrolase [Pseudonocardiaceae bacterium]
MSYAYDPELAPWATMLPQTDLSDVAAMRATVLANACRVPVQEMPADIAIRDVAVPGPAGAPEVPVRVYAPTGRREPQPAVLYIHGGGFVIGNLGLSDAECAWTADHIGGVVVAVDYRLAPEHPFPAGVEDCYAALRWMADQADELGIDRTRIAVTGRSSGGGLSAAVALLTRDRGGPALCFQLLDIPELDDRLDTPSMHTYVDTPMWSRSAAEFSWKYYLSGSIVDTSTVDVLQYAAPARATDLSGLPPAYVTVCEFDPLRDEGLSYAQRLLQAGVSVELHCYPGTFHGSTIALEAAVTKRMLADRKDALRRGLRVG